MNHEFLTAKEAAAELRMSERYVLDQLRAKKLRGTQFGRQWRIDPADLETYIQARANVRPVRRAS